MKKEKTKKEPFVVFETEEDFRSAIEKMAEIGIQKALREAPVVRPFVPINEVERKVGTTRLNKWIGEGKLYPIESPGQPTRFDRIQLMQISRMQFV